LKAREVLLLSCCLAILAVAGLLVFGGGAGEAEATDTMPAPAGPAAPPVESHDAAGSAPITAAAAVASRASSGADRKDGSIEGDVILAASLLPKLEHLTVLVREAINTEVADPSRKPFTTSQTFAIGRTTPQFLLDGIPFSPYGYLVSVHGENCNGSEKQVRIDATMPVAKIQLALTPGVPYSILLRDQTKLPIPDLEVALIPEGEPVGRPVLAGKRSDSFGAVVYETVLRGSYRVCVGSQITPLNAPLVIDVQATAGAQATTVEVPRGQPLTVRVHGPAYGVEGVDVVALATDSVQLRRFESKTDYRGEALFPHLPPGGYQLNINKQGYERTVRTVTLKEHETPAPIEVRLAPIVQ
jgi:hypothetical protein